MLPIRHRVEVLIYHKGLQKILLAQWKTPDSLTYVFPGGGIEEGETLEQAAIKEALEEVGVKIAQVKEIHRGPIKPLHQSELATQVMHRGEQTIYVGAHYVDRDYSKHNCEGDAMEFTWEPVHVAQSYLELNGGEDKEHRLQAMSNLLILKIQA